jgi:hypothetical protein
MSVLRPCNSNPFCSQYRYTSPPPDSFVSSNSRSQLDLQYRWQRRHYKLEVGASPSHTNIWAKPVTNFFAIAAEIQTQPTPPLFPRTATSTTAFHLNLRADTSRVGIRDISAQFAIPDLLPALRDFFSHYLRDQQSRTVAGRRGPLQNASVPFEHVRVWHSVRVQLKGGYSSIPTPADKLFASPPSDEWPTGRCDTAIFSKDAEGGPTRPPPGLDGKSWLCLSMYPYRQTWEVFL